MMRRRFMMILAIVAALACVKVSTILADTPPAQIWLPFITYPAPPQFDPAVDGFQFSNYTGATNYAKLTSVEVRRLFGDQVCATSVKSDGTCTLTPQGERWRISTNGYMGEGHCEGLAVTSLLLYNGQLNPQDFGASRTVDLTIENNPKLQREIAYWFATTFVTRSTTIQDSPNAVVEALHNDLFGTLRFSKSDGSGGHAVVPIRLTHVSANQVSIQVYDSNYPQATREILVDTAANTWFYSPDPSLTEDDYEGDATTKTLGFAPITPRLTTQPCPFCGYYAPSARQNVSQEPAIPLNQIFTGDVKLIPPVDSSYTSYQGALGTTGNESHKFPEKVLPMKVEVAFPSSNSEQLKSWQVPARPYFTFVPTATTGLALIASPSQTEPFTSSLVYSGPGYFFEIGHLLLEQGQVDLFEVAPGGTTITYTTSITGTGNVPELRLGFETAAADFDFYLYDFEMAAGDKVALTIDVVHRLIEVEIVTASSTDDVLFSFAMERIDDTSIDIFESPPNGLSLANQQILMIDYSVWDGNDNPLYMGYDDNNNGLLDDEELFEIEDIGDTFEPQP